MEQPEGSARSGRLAARPPALTAEQTGAGATSIVSFIPGTNPDAAGAAPV